MKRIAICGNIASGKSLVQRFLSEKGYKVLDTDDVSHELLTVNNKKLFETFKDFDVFENGEFSRTKLGKLIFSNKDSKDKLEDILHPQIAEKIKEFFETNKDEKLVFVAIPLLFEANMQDMFDKILFIYADDKIRLERLIKRNGYTLEYAKTRLASQMPQDEKIKQSDYVIYNNGTFDELSQSLSCCIQVLTVSEAI